MYKNKFRSLAFEIASNYGFIRMKINKCIQMYQMVLNNSSELINLSGKLYLNWNSWAEY